MAAQTASLGAQRLAASTEKPHRFPIGRVSAAIVLNALRHQRKNHSMQVRWPFEPQLGAQRLAASTEKPRPVRVGNDRITGVLNALRHQRKNHRVGVSARGSRQRDSSAQRLAASTEKPRNFCCRQFVGSDVLNALRHQRKNHSWATKKTCLSVLCSTPCGINGKTTRRIGGTAR